MTALMAKKVDDLLDTCGTRGNKLARAAVRKYILRHLHELEKHPLIGDGGYTEGYTELELQLMLSSYNDGYMDALMDRPL